MHIICDYNYDWTDAPRQTRPSEEVKVAIPVDIPVIPETKGDIRHK
jgi:hypothetical protein